jgi:hypothetical protein
MVASISKTSPKKAAHYTTPGAPDGLGDRV